MLEALFFFCNYWDMPLAACNSKATPTCLSCAHLCSEFSSLPLQNANFLFIFSFLCL